MVLGAAKALRATFFTNCNALSQRSYTALAGTGRILGLARQRPCPKQCAQLSSSGLDQKADSHLGLDSEVNILFKDSERKEKINLHDEPEEPQSSTKPWYLRVDSPLKAQRNPSEGQSIPELPKSPPAILEPLLQQLFLNLGLDNLTLLDLRHLDPPPALGTNLLMIIGTARSERHLNVSADRLCRWLRSQYKLSPSADGLLGRNELKLKMRRKNRKTKLVKSGTLDEDVDDGVTTGWICVNVGKVESARVEEAEAKREGFMGFGRKAPGVNIVIQILTNEKREELCLENLWSGISKQYSKLRTEATTAPEDVGMGVNSIQAPTQLPQDNLPKVETNYRKLPDFQKYVSCHITSSQSREFHSSTIRSSTLSSQLVQSRESNGIGPILLDQDTGPRSAMLSQKVLAAIESGDYNIAKSLLEHSDPEFRDGEWRTFLLNSIRVYLENLPPIEAVRNLGRGFDDTSSTPLLTYVYKTISIFPSSREWEFLVWMHCFAKSIGHPGFSTHGLSILYQQLELSGTPISSKSYLMLLRALVGGGWGGTMKIVENILRDMEYRIGNVLTEEVLVTLQEAVHHPVEERDYLEPPSDNSSFDLPIRPTSHVRSRLDTLIWTLEVPITRDESRIRLFNVYASKEQWVSFWKLWKSIALQGMPRSPALYSNMFRRVAETKNQKGCMKALRTWVPDMSREVPEVELIGEVREAVLACLLVADPDTDLGTILQEGAKGEWVDLWRKCLRK